MSELRPQPIDLAPARWVWLPCERTLPNTFVLFRREVEVLPGLLSATGWITADSRYRLTVNGRRVQWGPAPFDPRWADVDPLDIRDFLQPGANVIGVEVLHYGEGDGAWPLGKPGLLARFELRYENGSVERICTDDAWMCRADRAYTPGQHRRMFVRALQEVYDARRRQIGWDAPGFACDEAWVPARILAGEADKPSLCTDSPAMNDSSAIAAATMGLRTRQIPPMREVPVPVAALIDAGTVRWLRDPDDWFDMRVPGSLVVEPGPLPDGDAAAGFELPASPGDRTGVYATFRMPEHVIGWPYFTVDAPAGTVIEIITQEGHDPGATAWLDTYFFTWSRFVCREGVNRFETFDFESVMWMQLHVHGSDRPVTIREVGVRRRLYPWPHEPHIASDEPALQRLFEANVNTLCNTSHETIVDGVGRERQQYSGDCGHQLHAIRHAFGDTALPRRFLRTFSEGLTSQGYFLDCWPGYDRLARIMQREMGASQWGPILDHGVGFVFDCWHHYLETGDLEALAEPYPRLLVFADYLLRLRAERGDHGLAPATDIGVPYVWIDHDAYEQHRHKQCVFNLYVAGMLRLALAPMCRAFGEPARSEPYETAAAEIERAVVERFWDADRAIFAANLPWVREDGGERLCDRSLATAMLYGQCPGGEVAACHAALVNPPATMGLCYPANAWWRYRALAEAGSIAVVIEELRQRWATMPSVLQNNALQEWWISRADRCHEWSHCPMAPLNLLYLCIMGIAPLAPGFVRTRVQPRLDGLGALEAEAQTVRGPIRLAARPAEGGHDITLWTPAGMEVELVTATGVPGRAIGPGETRAFVPAPAGPSAPGGAVR